jgi:hypothetical protein
MKRANVGLWILVPSLVTGFFPIAASTAVAATVVVGTGNPNIDVPAVQAAVDQGGEVVLKGHFSFDKPATVVTALADTGYPPATVQVSKAVAISGKGEGDEMTTIDGGSIPFYVEAPGAAVAIQGLRFVRPKTEALLVYAASGLLVASCRIQGVVPLPGFGSVAIDIDTSGNIPTPAQPGKPENLSGRLLIVDNDIDVAGGTTLDNTVGLILWSVGVPGAEVEAHIARNIIRNFNEKGVNIRRVVGRVYVERNQVTTDTMMGVASGATGIFVANLGTYVLTHNSVHSRWVTGSGFGIDVRSQFATWPITGASIVGNDVHMDAPAGTVFRSDSAGIEIQGFAQGNALLDNGIRGRANAAVAVNPPSNRPSANNTVAFNRFDDLEASLADIFVSASATNTLLLGQNGTVDDQGTNTVIAP